MIKCKGKRGKRKNAPALTPAMNVGDDVACGGVNQMQKDGKVQCFNYYWQAG
jgi:hypothetical protein